MLGIIVSIISGLSMSIQGVFNTKLGDKIGVWETNLLVQGIGFALSLIAVFIAGKGSFKELPNANKLYLLGGVLGVVITYTVMTGIKSLGPTYAICIILVAQLTAAALIDAFGLFGCDRVTFGLNKIAGVIIMLVGIIIFKCKG